MCGGKIQLVEIEFFRDMPRAAEFERRKHGRIPNAISVNFSRRRKARMKIGASAHAFQHANFSRQIRVKRGDPVELARGHVRMSALRERVNACVRAARALDGNFFAANGSQRMLQQILHGVAASLALPAAKRAAIVCNSELQARHQPSIACESSQPCKIICAATWSITARLCFTFLPPACSDFCAATEVSRSSQNLISHVTRSCNCFANSRVFSAAGP